MVNGSHGKGKSHILQLGYFGGPLAAGFDKTDDWPDAVVAAAYRCCYARSGTTDISEKYEFCLDRKLGSEHLVRSIELLQWSSLLHDQQQHSKSLDSSLLRSKQSHLSTKDEMDR